jgi:hypothetical protein
LAEAKRKFKNSGKTPKRLTDKERFELQNRLSYDVLKIKRFYDEKKTKKN